MVSWRTDFSYLTCLIISSLLLFWNSNIDLQVAVQFYDPCNKEDSWPLGNTFLSVLLYEIVPWLTILLLCSSILITFFFLYKKNLLLILYALLIMLTVIIGPGLTINALFKDYWERPRPRQILILGGNMSYVAPFILNKNQQGGSSFPSGHSAIGFSLLSFWLIWRKSNPHRAKYYLIIGIIIGSMIGLSRMSSGAHYLSDILFSAWFTWLSALFSYYLILQLPSRE